jgi:hypothetical protein
MDYRHNINSFVFAYSPAPDLLSVFWTVLSWKIQFRIGGPVDEGSDKEVKVQPGADRVRAQTS